MRTAEDGFVTHHIICKCVNDWTLQLIIEHFDDVVKGIDFGHLPDWKSEEYRQLVLQTANDQLFSKGRYSEITEWSLEIFGEKVSSDRTTLLKCVKMFDEHAVQYKNSCEKGSKAEKAAQDTLRSHYQYVVKRWKDCLDALNKENK